MQLYGYTNIPIDALRSRLAMLEDNIDSLKTKGREQSSGAIGFYLEMSDIYSLLGHLDAAFDAAKNAEEIAETPSAPPSRKSAKPVVPPLIMNSIE